MFQLAGASHDEARAFLSHATNAALMVVLIVSLLYHAMLGLQVVIEDYVHHRPLELVLHFLTRAGAFIGMAIGILHVLKLALGA
jgi:succinate dehydrogenase / fumarate reductase membrane anchor subunit